MNVRFEIRSVWSTKALRRKRLNSSGLNKTEVLDFGHFCFIYSLDYQRFASQKTSGMVFCEPGYPRNSSIPE